MKPNQKTVLCCDDESELCELVSEEIEQWGYNVVRAHSGKEAVKIVQEHHVDAIVTDVRMPDGDGFFVTKQVRALFPKFPCIIFVTGYLEVSVEEAYDCGVDAVVDKPLDFQLLKEALAKNLESMANKYSRNHERVDVKMNASYECVGLADAVQGQILNLGRGGFFLTTKNALPAIGDVVRFSLEFKTHTTKIFSGVGICRWVRDGDTDLSNRGVGLEFLSLDEKALKDFIDFFDASTVTASIPKCLGE